MNKKLEYLNKVSKVQKRNFDKITQLEDRLGTLIDLADEADNLVEPIEDAFIAWENQVYTAKEFYNAEIRDQIESIEETFNTLGVSLEGTDVEWIKRQAEELAEKLSKNMDHDLFEKTREIKNQFT